MPTTNGCSRRCEQRNRAEAAELHIRGGKALRPRVFPAKNKLWTGSDEPMSRVFVTAFGAPTPSGEAIVQDSGELGGAFSNSGSYGITVQSADILHNGSWNTFEYGIYAVVPVAVPEPSTYAMTLASLACGGYSMWRQRKGADAARPI